MNNHKIIEYLILIYADDMKSANQIIKNNNYARSNSYKIGSAQLIDAIAAPPVLGSPRMAPLMTKNTTLGANLALLLFGMTQLGQ